MQVKVTNRHLTQGTKGDLHKCPVCLSLRETFETQDVEVGGVYAKINNIMYTLPRKCTDIDNQNLYLVQPFLFDIRVAT